MREDGNNSGSGTVSRKLCERSIFKILSGNFAATLEILLWLRSSSIPERFPGIKFVALTIMPKYLLPTFIAASNGGHKCEAPSTAVYTDHFLRPRDPEKSDIEIHIMVCIKEN